MSLPKSARSFRPVLAAIVCLAAIVLATPAARAGLGDLVKKAKEKVAPSSPKSTAAPAGEFKLVFADPVVELTGERLDHILATYEAAASASAGRAELVTKLNALQEERGALWEKEGEKIMALQNKRDEVKGCYENGYAEAGQRRMQEYASRALTDPALREKFARVAAENNEAVQKGDSAAIARAQNAIHEEVLPTKEDSAAVRKQCGSVPPISATETKIASLDKQIASLYEQIRAIDAKVSKGQAKQGGLTDHQWGIAIDRIVGYLASQKRGGEGGGKGAGKGFGRLMGGGGSGADDGGGSGGAGATTLWNTFSPVELEALGKRQEQLRKFLG